MKNTLSLLSASLLLVACAGKGTNTICVDARRPAASSPHLELQLPRTELMIGENIEASFTLVNDGGESLIVCANGWNNYHFIAADGSNKGFDHASPGISTADLVRLPPHSRLQWIASVAVPAISPGPAELYGLFVSDCGWRGRLWSEPIAVVLGTSQLEPAG